MEHGPAAMEMLASHGADRCNEKCRQDNDAAHKADCKPAVAEEGTFLMHERWFSCIRIGKPVTRVLRVPLTLAASGCGGYIDVVIFAYQS